MADHETPAADLHDAARCTNPNCTVALPLCWDNIERLRKLLDQLQAELDRVKTVLVHLKPAVTEDSAHS